MSFWTRLLALLGIKAGRALERLEDPAETLDASYERQLDLVRQLRRGIVEVATAKKRIEMQVQEIGARHERLEPQAREALRQGRDDLARSALSRRAMLEAQATSLRDQYAGLEAQEQKLVASQASLAARIEAFRIEKETMKAAYRASSARVQVNEALGGISSEMSDVGRSLERARDHVAQLSARAAATDDLLDRGALAVTSPDADLERELGQAALATGVEERLRAMKAELGSDTPRPVPQIGTSGDREKDGSPGAI